MPRSERLTRLVEHFDDVLTEDQLGIALAEVSDFLDGLGIELEEDLTVDEYIQTLYHMNDCVEGREEFETIGLEEGPLAQKLKAGFKMVFGKVVKVGKRLAHRGLAKYNNMRADRAQGIANKFRSKARSHQGKATALRPRGARRPVQKPMKRIPVHKRVTAPRRSVSTRHRSVTPGHKLPSAAKLRTKSTHRTVDRTRH